jgi:hypothetical protein
MEVEELQASMHDDLVGNHTDVKLVPATPCLSPGYILQQMVLLK